MERRHQRIRGDLAGGVRGLGRQRVILVDRDAAGGPVHLARRGVHEALDARVARGDQGIQRAHHIGLRDVDGVDVQVRNGDQRPEVEHDLLPLRRARDRVRIAQIPRHPADGNLDAVVNLRQQSRVARRSVVDEGGHRGARADKGFHEMAADESTGPRHQNARPAPTHADLTHATVSSIPSSRPIAAR